MNMSDDIKYIDDKEATKSRLFWCVSKAGQGHYSVIAIMALYTKIPCHRNKQNLELELELELTLNTWFIAHFNNSIPAKQHLDVI